MVVKYITVMKKILLYLSFLLPLTCCISYNNTSPTPSSTNNSIPYNEAQEFAELIKKDSIERKERAVEAVNLFLGETMADTKSAILFRNNSNCNIIIRISGKNTSYKLPIEKQGINYIVLSKGNYTFYSKICNSIYRATKELNGSIEVSLSSN